MDFFEKKPSPKPKNKRSDEKDRSKNKLKDSGVCIFQTSDTLIPKEDNNSQNEKTNNSKKLELTKNLCNICLVMPKNGIFNHGKVGHIFSCYQCAKHIWRTSNRCPVCNVKVQFVTKMITA